jgi:hypothetical protein
MNREATITVRVPEGMKAFLVEKAKAGDRSMSDQVIAMIYRGALADEQEVNLPPDKVWQQLLANKHLLPQRAASAEEKAELAAFRRKGGATVTTSEALALLGEPPEAAGVKAADLVELKAIRDRLSRIVGHAEATSTAKGSAHRAGRGSTKI